MDCSLVYGVLRITVVHMTCDFQVQRWLRGSRMAREQQRQKRKAEKLAMEAVDISQ